MNRQDDLIKILQRIDRKGYKAYKEIRGTYQFQTFTLIIDHVQGDPFAEPSRLRILVPQSRAAFPPDTYHTRSREIALRDYLTRQFHLAVHNFAQRQGRGTGKSGLIQIDVPGQEILLRTSCLVNNPCVELRFKMGLPAAGRSILGRQAVEMFCHELPEIVRASLLFESLDSRELFRHIESNEDQDALREMLKPNNLVAFVANGSCLPRLSGVDDRPLDRGAVLFRSPKSLQYTFRLPNRGSVSGMGIPHGVTLIVGGGYHGKSTLLDALQRSVYNHIPGDGRELCATVADAVKIRAEDGRNIEKVDISPFISNLPYGKNTTAFSTADASGSTSQAASIIEMLEVGAVALFVDEDTSATNFMIRDRRMQLLVAKEKEPITPLIDKIRLLYSEKGVSSVLVVGGSGDYLDVADTVIAMEEYIPKEVSAEAKRVVAEVRTERESEGGESFGSVRDRVVIAESVDASRGKRGVKIKVFDKREIGFGMYTIDLTALEQFVSTSQVRAVADALVYARDTYMNKKRCLREVVELVEQDFAEKGLDVLSKWPLGHYALPRKLEIAAVLNRLRCIRVEFASQIQ